MTTLFSFTVLLGYFGDVDTWCLLIYLLRYFDQNTAKDIFGLNQAATY